MASRSHPKTGRYLFLDSCSPEVRSLIDDLAKQDGFHVIDFGPRRAVLWSDIEAYSAAGSGPDADA